MTADLVGAVVISGRKRNLFASYCWFVIFPKESMFRNNFWVDFWSSCAYPFLEQLVSGIAMPSGSDKLYTGSKDKTVMVWDCQSGQVGVMLNTRLHLFFPLVFMSSLWRVAELMKFGDIFVISLVCRGD